MQVFYKKPNHRRQDVFITRTCAQSAKPWTQVAWTGLTRRELIHSMLAPANQLVPCKDIAVVDANTNMSRFFTHFLIAEGAVFSTDKR